MAITAVFDAPGVTIQQYEQIVGNLEGVGLGAPDGRIFHVANQTENGWLVVDVWESEELLGKFAETLMPMFDAIGVTLPPPRILQVLNIIKT